MNEQDFLIELFRRYYQQHPLTVKEIGKREFGVGNWDKKIAVRHMEFRSERGLQEYLVRQTPLYISYSAAYYEFPAARPMVKKNWLGADLIFDIDVHHADWDKEKKYPDCGKFTCEHCLVYAKGQVTRLIEDFLMPDFGFSREEIKVNFSGNRGYHVHIQSSAVKQLGREARREIADYIGGKGLEFGSFFYKKGEQLLGPRPTDWGFRGKFARAVLALAEDKQKAVAGLTRKFSDENRRLRFIEGIREGNWSKSYVPDAKHKFQEIFSRLALRFSEQVDVGVTMDISRLIRLPNSIHGGSGLVAKETRSLENFDPLRDALAFGREPVKLRLREDVPEFQLGGRPWGPFEKGREIHLPEYGATYLICKGAASLAES